MQNNQSLFVNQELSKAIIVRTGHRNKLLKEKSNFNKKVFNKRQNYFVGFLKITKKQYYGNRKEKM